MKEYEVHIPLKRGKQITLFLSPSKDEDIYEDERAGGVPHVTLAVNLTNGGAAVDSKYITEWLPLSTPIALSGHIVVHYRTEDSIDR